MKAAIALLIAFIPAAASARDLRVCADPNNLPYSNAQGEGFENRIVRLIAADLHAEVRYTWWAQRRGNVRETLGAHVCDLIPGVASGVEMLATTRPYYRSTYVAVTRAQDPPIASLDDPRLQTARIGVQLIGDDGSNIPPAHSLTNRGIIGNVRGYPIYGDHNAGDPQSGIFDALQKGEIDVAFAWGPTAGYFAKREGQKLHLTPVTPQIDGPNLPMLFDISMGVRKDDLVFKREIEQALARHADEIRTILRGFGVPAAD